MIETENQKSKSLKWSFMSAIALPGLAIALSNTAVNLLLIEIALTFQVNAGIAAQIRTANAGGEFLFAILVGIFALRFKHKNMVISGVLLVAISAFGTFFAPNMPLMLFFSFLEGAGTVITVVMTITIIAETLHASKKVKAVSLITAAGFISTLAGTVIISYIATVESWRYVFLLFIFPVSIASLALVTLGFPSKEQNPTPSIKRTANLSDLKLIFSKKSASACIMAALFFTGADVAVFRIAFFRQQFLFSLEYIVYFTLITATILIIGTVFTGRYGNKIGIRKLSIFSILGSGIFVILMFLASNIWLALIFSFTQSGLTAVALAAYPCLAVDQVKSLRGLTMSFTRIFSSIGRTIAPAVGGFFFVLLSVQSGALGYIAVGLTFGIMNITAAIFCILTKDPTDLNIESTEK